MNQQKEYLYYIIYQVKRQFPKTPLFYFINLFLKSLGLFICTHNIRGLESSNFTINKILSRLIIVDYKAAIIKTYEYQALTLFLISTIFFIYNAITFPIIYYKQKKGQMNKECNEENFLIKNINRKLSSYLKISLTISAFILLILVVLNQHLFEMLLMGIYVAFVSKSNIDTEKMVIVRVISFSVLGIINIISLILLLLYYWIFMVISIKKMRTVKICYRSYPNAYSFYFVFISVFFQGIHSINSILPLDYKDLVHIILTSTIVVLLIIDTWVNIAQSSINKSFYFKCFDYVKLDCMFSGIIEIILYFTIPKNQLIPQSISYYKEIIEIVIAFAASKLIHLFYTNKKIKSLSSKLFVKVDIKPTIEELNLFFNLIRRAFIFKESNNFKALFEILQEHCAYCTNSKCLCYKISNFDHESSKISYNNKLEKIIKEMILIGEQEINNIIANLIQGQANKDLTNLIFYHIDYIALIKHDTLLAFYLVHSYSSCSTRKIQYSFMDRYHLYEAKRYLFYSFITKQKVVPKRLSYQRLNIPSFNSHKQFSTIFPLYKYLTTKDILFKCVLYCCHNLNEIISYLSSSNLYKNVLASANDLLNLLIMNKKLNERLLVTFVNDFIKKDYKSLSINYILSYYLMLYHGEIPKEYEMILEPQFNYLLIEQESHCYDSYAQENNSLISTLTNDDTFNITYVSNVFCEKFHWLYDDMINHDFNILLPDSFGINHNIYLKLFALSSINSFNKSTFLINGTGALVPITFISKKILLLKEGFNLIFIFTKLKIYSKTQMIYNVFLGRNFDILSVSNTFEKHFYFTKEMFAKLKINFCDFMGLNTQRLETIFNKIIEKNIIPIKLEEINKAISIYNTISDEKVFQYRGFNYTQSLLEGNIKKTYNLQISKTEFCNSATKILQFAKNFNLENSIVERIGALKDRIYQTIFSKEKKEKFLITFDLRVIGKLLYFVVFIRENITKDKLLEFQTFSPSYLINSKKNDEINSIIFKTNSRAASINVKMRNPLNQYDTLLAFKDKTTSFTSSIRFLESSHATSESVTFNTNNRFINSSQFKLMNYKIHSQNDTDSIIKTKVVSKNQVSKCIICIELLVNSVFKPIIFVLIFLIITLILVNTIFLLYSFELSLNIFKINYESFILKSDIAFCSLLFIRNCLIKEEINSINALDFTWKFQLRSQSMLNHLNLLLSYINRLHSFDRIDQIYKVLYSDDEFKLLLEDWTETVKRSTLIEELYSIYFFFISIFHSNTFHSCNVKDYNTSEFKNLTRSPYPEEKFLYYIINNSLSSLINQINLLSNNTLSVFNDFQTYTQNIYFSTSVTVMILSFTLFILLLIKLICNETVIREQLLSLYTNRDNENIELIKKKIMLLENALNTFNKSNCQSYESVAHLSLKISTKFKLNNPKKSMGMGMGSSLSFATAIENKKKPSKEKSQLLRISIENLKHFSQMVRLRIVTNIIITLTVLFIINFVLQVGLLLFISNRINDLKVQNDIGVNLLEEIPLFAELLLYYSTSIIQNDPYYISKNKPDFDINKLNYYNVQIDFVADSLYIQLQKSNYVFLYFKLQFAQISVEKFMSDQKNHNWFPETLEWNKNFNTERDFPIYTAIGFVKYYQTCKTLTHCLFLVNKYSADNLYIENKMANNAMDSVFDLMTQELNSLYLDFNGIDNSDGKRDKIAFLSPENFWIIFENSQRAIKAASDIFNVSLFNDVFKIYTNTKLGSMIISILIIFSNLICIYICVYFTFSKLEKKILVLKSIGAKIINFKRYNSSN